MEAPATTAASPFKVKLKLGPSASSPVTPQTATFASPQPTPSEQMDWQAAPVASTSAVPVDSAAVAPASVEPVAEAPKSTAIESEANSKAAQSKKRKADGPPEGEAAKGEAGPGKAWRKGLKGYTAKPAKPKPPQNHLPKEGDPAASPNPQGRVPASTKGPFAPNQPFEPRLPRPRQWTKAPTAVKLLSGHTLTLPAWQGAASSDYLIMRKQAQLLVQQNAQAAKAAREAAAREAAAAAAMPTSNVPTFDGPPHPDASHLI